MSREQMLIIAVLAVTVGFFLWGRWRHDVVALAALLLCAALGLVPDAEAFTGFGHPAVITVACVLVLGAGLQSAGTIDVVVKRLLPGSAPPFVTELSLMGLAVVLSAFMNNVGALALLMPVALKLAERQGRPAGLILMPLAFGSILGGMTTLIGTPPNLIVSGFRQEAVGAPFAMFDFAPVGVVVALTGLVLVLLLGRFLVPPRERTSAASFATGTYLTEARVPDDTPAVGMTLGEAEAELGDADALVVGLIRGERRLPAPNRYREIHAGDILILRAEPEQLADALAKLKLELEEAVSEEKEKGSDADRDQSADEAGATGEATAEATGEATGKAEAKAEAKAKAKAKANGKDKDKSRSRSESRGKSDGKARKFDDIELAELAVLPNSDLAGRSATDVQLRTRYGINLLAVSRQGKSPVGRLRTLRIATGDVLLVQGTAEALSDFGSRYGCVPLAERALNLARPARALTAAVVMLGAIVATVAGLAAPATAFAAGVLLFLLLKVVSPRELYHAVDWPVIVLLGALMPVAGAMESTGAADLLARLLLEHVAQGSPVVALVLIFVLTMSLSDFMNNAATAAVMCPIAIGTAASLGVNADPYLMGVAVGASCAFLTPIGHQNNTLILGPGGFRFGDYWRLGLPLEIVVVAVGVPMILRVWPL